MFTSFFLQSKLIKSIESSEMMGQVRVSQDGFFNRTKKFVFLAMVLSYRDAKVFDEVVEFVGSVLFELVF